VTAADVESVDEIKPGTGATVFKKRNKSSSLSDDAGALHEHSALLQTFRLHC